MIGLPAAKAPGTVGYAGLADLAAEQGADFAEAKDPTLRASADRIRACAPDYLLVIGWSRLIPPEVLAVPAAGAIGMHPTRLPFGRGQAPIPWTIIKGLDSTALSVFLLRAGADTGPLIAQYELPVRPRETSASLFHRVGHTHFTAGHDLAERLSASRPEGTPQNDAEATRWPKRRPADGRLDHAMTYPEIDALVRAQLGPYPRAFVALDGQDIPVRGARLSPGPESKLEELLPRTVRFGCADGVAELTRD
nr:formyltransferase family protein [Streptomyces coryli]